LGIGLVTRRRAAAPSWPVADAQGRILWRNWSGVQHAYPTLRARPANLDDLKAVLATAPGPIRPVGGGQSSTALSVTPGTLLSIERMTSPVRWDGTTAVVSAAMGVDDFRKALAAQGRALALPNGVEGQTIGGALATGLHASGARLAALHAALSGLTLVTADGQVLACDDFVNADIFHAARVSLGLLGVIVELRFSTAPAGLLRRRTWSEPFNDAIATAEARWAGLEQFEMRIAPFSGRAVCIALDRAGPPTQPPALEAEPGWRDLKTARDLLSWAPPLRRAAVGALQPTSAPDDPASLRYNEMEFHLPADAQLAALAEVVKAVETLKPDVFLPIRATRTASDDAWLSPFQGGPKGSISVRAYGEDDYSFLFERIQPILLRHGGRPHWGKLHALRGDRLAALYPRWDDFLKLRARLDPTGRLLNLYLEGMLGLT
jgi:FAD-linked oxidoreductase